MSVSDDELEVYLAHIERGSIAVSEGLLQFAEEEFRSGLSVAEATWGPYSWAVSDALEHISYCLELQNRLDESDVAQSLSDKIARRK